MAFLDSWPQLFYTRGVWLGLIFSGELNFPKLKICMHVNPIQYKLRPKLPSLARSENELHITNNIPKVLNVNRKQMYNVA